MNVLLRVAGWEEEYDAESDEIHPEADITDLIDLIDLESH